MENRIKAREILGFTEEDEPLTRSSLRRRMKELAQSYRTSKIFDDPERAKQIFEKEKSAYKFLIEILERPEERSQERSREKSLEGNIFEQFFRESSDVRFPGTVSSQKTKLVRTPSGTIMTKETRHNNEWQFEGKVLDREGRLDKEKTKELTEEYMRRMKAQRIHHRRHPRLT